MNLHHGGAEGLENESKDVFIFEFAHHLCDLCASMVDWDFAGHDQILRLYYLRLTIHYCVVTTTR